MIYIFTERYLKIKGKSSKLLLIIVTKTFYPNISDRHQSFSKKEGRVNFDPAVIL
jgi:hypothetical protein